MTMPEEFTVPQAAAYLSVSEETVRRNIRSRCLKALRRGTQWFIPQDVLVIFADSYDPKTGKIRQMLQALGETLADRSVNAAHPPPPVSSSTGLKAISAVAQFLAGGHSSDSQSLKSRQFLTPLSGDR